MTDVKLRIKIGVDPSVRRCRSVLRRLAKSGRYSPGFLKLLTNRLVDLTEVRSVPLAATRADMAFRLKAPQRYLKLLAALLAADRLCDREIPFHRGSKSI